MAMITISGLSASVDGIEILKGLDLVVKKGEIHAIMGPNGAGKSTLAKVLAGHPAYEVTAGTVVFKDQDLLALDPEERSHLGLFMSFQYPIELPGVTNFQFLHAALNAGRKARGEEPYDEAAFDELMDQKMTLMDIRPEFKHRNVNEGYSGGEKKRNEILQMAVLSPELAVLDETDSGLDIDAIRVVAKGVNTFATADNGLILITHYQRLLDYVKPDFVHVMIDGCVVRSGGPELALELEERGYDWLVPSSGAKQEAVC